MDGGIAAEALLGLPVRLRGIPLGRPVDVVLDADARRAIGLEVVCRDDVSRYLPLAAAQINADEIRLGSALLLFEQRDLAFYRRRALTLRALRGAAVEDGRRRLGTLADIVIGRDGAVVELVVEGPGGRRALPFATTVRINPPRRVSAA